MRALWSRAAPSPGSCAPARACVVAVSVAGFPAVRRRQSTLVQPWRVAYKRMRKARDRPLSAAEKLWASEGAQWAAMSDHTPLEALPADLDWVAVEQAVAMDVVDDDDDVGLLHKMHSRAYDDPDDPDDLDVSWNDLRFDSSLPGTQALQWPPNTGRPVAPYNLPPQSLWAPDELRWAAMRRRLTWKKLSMSEFVTALLIHNLMRALNVGVRFIDLSSLSPQIARLAALSPAEAQRAKQDIHDSLARLRMTPVDSRADDIARAREHPEQPAIPCYTQDADGDFHAVAQQLNRGLRHLLHHASSKKMPDMDVADIVAKICHNLLVSSASPDVQSYNILLTGFKRLRRPDLVDRVVDAFHASKIRPNEITCREVLGHYITQSRPEDFSQFVSLMRGVGDALMLANPATNVNEASQGRLVRVSNTKVYQKMYPTPMVFGVLIGGVMKFAGFDRALDVYYEMKADGWGLDVPSLNRLLGDCIRRQDWEGGSYVWQEISSIKTIAMPYDMARSYEFMLSLCSVTGQTAAFNRLLSEVVMRGFDRKSILDAAMDATHWAQRKRTSHAPAWAADNVMIAVSGFVSDSKWASRLEEMPADVEQDDDMFVHSALGENASEYEDDDDDDDDDDDGPDTGPGSEELDRIKADQESWASWVEAEFGERPKDPEP
jgi:pentatricopeptide repeat protein